MLKIYLISETDRIGIQETITEKVFPTRNGLGLLFNLDIIIILFIRRECLLIIKLFPFMAGLCKYKIIMSRN